MIPEEDKSDSNLIIDEALAVALMTTRLLRAWHSGETDPQDSMQILWEGVCQIRAASGTGFQSDQYESERSGHRSLSLPDETYGVFRTSGSSTKSC
jgi:hypothetical protein